MLVNDKHLTTIWYDNAKDVVKIIDQRLLPFDLKIVELKTLEDFCFAIKEMQVRGAPLIGVTAAYGMYVASKTTKNFSELEKAGDSLKSTRPTAVNLSWAVDKIISKIHNSQSDDHATTNFTAGYCNVTAAIDGVQNKEFRNAFCAVRPLSLIHI